MEIQNDVKNIVAGVMFSQSKGAYKLEESEQLAPIVRRVVDWANNNYKASVATEPVLPTPVAIPRPSNQVSEKYAVVDCEAERVTQACDARDTDEDLLNEEMSRLLNEEMSRLSQAKVDRAHASTRNRDAEEAVMMKEVEQSRRPLRPSQSTMNYAPAPPTIYNAANLSNSIETISLPIQ
jgi:hypothetical protein